MVGIAAMLLTEQLLQRPLIMFGVDGKAAPADAELNERLTAWATDAGADLVADEDKVAMLFFGGKSAAPAKSGGLFSAFAKGGASVKNAKKGPERVSQPIAMVASVPDPKPKIVGDMGFDPLGLGGDENFAFMREAELKHGRLAMLAAVAWPLQEILHPIVADATGSKNALMESNGASPSLLNGGLLQWEVLPALLLFTAGCEQLERSDMTNRREMGCAWNEYSSSFGIFGRLPGNFGFDPLNLYRPLSAADKVSVQERELANGRLAMLAVASYVVTEFVFRAPVVAVTPALFQPLFMNPSFMAMMDASFGVASLDRPL
jgi:hypothetical protein